MKFWNHGKFSRQIASTVWYVLLLVVARANAAESFDARPASGGIRPQDEFWIASTRELPSICLTPDSNPAIRWRRYRLDSGWSDATLDEFIGSAKTGIHTFYIPGNRVANAEAEQRGWKLYSTLAGASDTEPLRVVVWSWPSDKIHGQKPDFRVKAARTGFESAYLGWIISQFGPQDRVSLVGYSYGARIISGALHIMTGADLDGSRIALKDPPRVRAVLMASAAPNYWMLPGQVHQQAVNQVDKMLVLYNSRDTVLKHYHLIDDCGHPRALGYRGFNAQALSANAERIQQRDVGQEVGSTHDENRYYGSCTVLNELQRYLLWGPTTP